ncbi:MAG: ribonuclease J [Pelagibacteraceae bacterium]|jgi:ribonuclease J|nr:ribonuclease J [Pelagibacteraceae bacterium]MBO6483435.1 ribonuclease J [Pelagibacteraceae bacterium]MBO6484247.1 ribonuclease J [Pelagibacteraceae bacterium]MBO6487157.1 ribonuclease J [Pelagibacteraceae bacterium]MBO6488024.1 ribonuclease J [Pelagibacteraceae bacterium]
MSKEELIFCPLGGSGEIGMNMNLFAYGNETNQKWIIVDMGVTFADDSIPGVDLIYPDPGFIIDKKDDLLGIVLTHAHEDHIGAISHIWPDLKCNIYATPFTAVLIKEKFKEKKIDITKKLKIVELNGSIKLGSFNIEFVTLTHSILEPNGLSIKTPVGTILHTGDWKVDPNPLIGEKVNEKKLKEIGNEKVLAMICDSTNVFNLGRAGSESDVRDSLLKIMSLKSKRIVVTSFASNVARMESIFYCAEKINREISLVGRSMNRIFKAARQCGYLKNIKDPIDPREAKKFPREKIVYLCTGSQGEPMGAMKRIIKGIHPDVFLEKNDVIIFSSKIIPGNEKKLYSLHNDIIKQDIELVTEETDFVHVSGHPNREDLKDMYNWVKPNSIIPVHGEHRHMNEHMKFAKEMQIPHALRVENGDIIRIFPGDNPSIIDKAPSGRMYLDGSVGVGEDSQSIKERRKLSQNGYLEITLILNNSGKLNKPIISYRGIPENLLDEKIIFKVEDEIFNTCKMFSMKNKNQEKNLIESLKQNCRRIIRDKTGKKPFTNINIARL